MVTRPIPKGSNTCHSKGVCVGGGCRDFPAPTQKGTEAVARIACLKAVAGSAEMLVSTLVVSTALHGAALLGGLGNLAGLAG